MTATPFTDLVGCRLPIQLAPMGGGVGSPTLAAAVTVAGGLGMLPSSYPMPVTEQIAAVARLTNGPVGVAFFAFDFPHRLDDLEAAAAACRVIDVFWGEPDASLVARIHAGGALALWQVGAADDARAAVDAGCDAVVAQGVEAGGHVCGTTPLLDLLDQVVPVTSVPVVAAGGISTAAALRRVLDAGAAGARIGTRLLATTESDAHPDYLAALVAATGDDTELTTAFAGGWPNAPHRVLRRCIQAASTAPEVLGSTDLGGNPWPVERWSALPPSRTCTGQVEAMAMYAGRGVGDVTDIRPVADVLAELVSE